MHESEERPLIGAGPSRPASRAMSPLRVAARHRLHEAEIASLSRLSCWERETPSKPAEGPPGPSRDATAALRTLPVNAVAAALRFFEPIPPRANAIDLVKLATGWDFGPACAWLAAAGIDPVETESVDLDAPATRAEAMKRELVSAQLAALAAPAYRLTVMRRVDDGNIGINLGKAPDGGPERVWDKAGVLAAIPRLIQQNVADGNVFITPLQDGVEHALLDDLDAAALDEIRGRGYRPAMVLESSPGSFQAIVKVPKAAADRRAIMDWFNDANRAYGDEAISGLTHPFRLVGFENRKPKHRDGEGRYPWVRLIEANGAICRKATEVVQAYRDGPR